MANLNAYDSWRLSEPPGWNDEASIPEVVSIPVEELVFQGGRFVVTAGDVWAVIETRTNSVDAFQGANGERVYDTPVWFCDAVNAFLRTAEGAKHVQYYIARELEG